MVLGFFSCDKSVAASTCLCNFSVKAQYIMGRTGAQKRRRICTHLYVYLSESSVKVVKGMQCVPHELTNE